MTYKELVQTVAKFSDVQEKDVDAVLKVFATTVEKSIVKGEKVSLPKFGSFSQAVNEPRPLPSNPSRMSERSLRCKFNPTQTLKDRINGK